MKEGNCNSLSYCAVAVQSYRLKMEDAFLIKDLGDKNTLFGVFDGHGGEYFSKMVAEHFPQILSKMESYKKGNYAIALYEVFKRIDEWLRSPEVVQLIRDK